ncbi:hypothetical protein [Curtobacterium sp. UCD-KPL2560]|uniref:hypothetical protein n=1 Tax=Curtobacterium sp. UCD-KPL2560 TaxID=1885315 RepID=UPI0008264920|nr:hypothetical protein [Curtobacterium sp. UCD-KPL2560]
MRSRPPVLAALAAVLTTLGLVLGPVPLAAAAGPDAAPPTATAADGGAAADRAAGDAAAVAPAAGDAAAVAPAATDATAASDPEAPADPDQGADDRAVRPEPRVVANTPTGVSLTPIDSRTYRVTGKPRCGLLETTCQIHVGDVGGDYHWDGGTSEATFAAWPMGQTRTPTFWTYACIGALCKNSAKVSGTPVTRPYQQIGLSVHLDAQDDAGRTARVSGEATANAVIKRNGVQVAAAPPVGTVGKWSATVTGLSVGANVLTFEQYVDGVRRDTASVTVTIAEPVQPGQITGDTGSAVLERGGTTTAYVTFTAKRAFTTPTGTLDVTAPSGTTFATGQTAQRGEYLDGSTWRSFGGDSLVDGSRSGDGTKYSFTLGKRNWNVAKDQRFRFGLRIETPSDVQQSQGALTGHLRGSITGGTFDTTATTTTTVPEPGRPLTATPRDVDPARRTATLVGTAPTGAGVVVVSWRRDGVEAAKAVKVEDGAWSLELDGLAYGTNPVHVEAYGATALLAAIDVDVEVGRPAFDGAATFDADVTKPVTVGGHGTPGATVVLREGAVAVATVRVADPEGTWSTTLTAPDRGGARTLEATQTVTGQDPQTVTIVVDYGAAVRITSPGDGFVIPPAFPDVRIAGVAAPHARVRLSEQGVPGSDLGTVEADDAGRWSVRTSGLPFRDQVLLATAQSRGANTTTATIRLTAG